MTSVLLTDTFAARSVGDRSRPRPRARRPRRLPAPPGIRDEEGTRGARGWKMAVRPRYHECAAEAGAGVALGGPQVLVPHGSTNGGA